MVTTKAKASKRKAQEGKKAMEEAKMLPRLPAGLQGKLARQEVVSGLAPMTHSTLKQRRGGSSQVAVPRAAKAKGEVSIPKEKPPRGIGIAQSTS